MKSKIHELLDVKFISVSKNFLSLFFILFAMNFAKAQCTPPDAPATPTAQNICYTRDYTFTFAGVMAGNGGDQIEWALNDTFSNSNFITSPGNINITVSLGSTISIFLRSVNDTTGCVSAPVSTVATVNLLPSSPVPPAPQATSSDSAYTFIFSNLSPGYGGNELEWSLDKNFSSSNILSCSDTLIDGFDSSTCSINVILSPGADTLIWLRSRDSVSTCVSDAVNTIAILASYPSPPTDTFHLDTMICSGTSALLCVPHSQSGVRYALVTDSAREVNSAYGNDTILFISTGILDTITIFNIIGTDTATGNTVYTDSKHAIFIAPQVGIPDFIQGDEILYIDSPICYNAVANYGTQIIYSIVDSGAVVDSLSGCISNVTGDFTIRATAFGIYNCSSAYADLYVKVTTVAPPKVPDAQTVTADSTEAHTFTFTDIIAGAGGDKIEWASDTSFANSTIASSPATITFTLAAGKDTTFWLRTKNSASGAKSKAVKAKALNAFKFLSAGLLDKRDWVRDDMAIGLSDEFDNLRYTLPIPPQNGTNFTDKWALNYCFGSCSGDPCDPLCCNNHVSSLAFMNSKNDGTGDEVLFQNQTAIFTATAETPPIQPLSSDYNSTCPSTTFPYKSGMLFSQKQFNPEQPALLEIRYKNPGGVASHPNFWAFSWADEFDIAENYLGWDNMNRSTSTIWDYTFKEHPHGSDAAGCPNFFWKQTSCNYPDDWHTYSMLITPDLTPNSTFEPEFVFFIDGKETWSYKRKLYGYYPDGVGPIDFPAVLNPPGGSPNLMRFLLTLDVDPGYISYWPSYEWDVDYVRCYYPKPGLRRWPRYFQNPGITQQFPRPGLPVTLESPGAYGNTANNKPIYFTNTHQVSRPLVNSKIGITGAGNHLRLFYQVQMHNNPGLLYTANTDNWGNWFENPIYARWLTATAPLSPVMDIGGFITPANPNLVYYQDNTIYGTLMYLKYFTGTGWIKYPATVGYNPYNTVTNCAGYLNIDFQGKVFFKDGYNNFECWNPNNQILTQCTSDQSVHGALLVTNCGCMAFYTDKNYNLRQLYWANSASGWQQVNGTTNGIVVSANSNFFVTDNLVLDETHQLIYFVGSDGAIYSYPYNFSDANTNADALRKLGYDDCSNNAQTSLAVSPDGDFVYYKADDGNLWYFYNDHDYLDNNGIPRTGMRQGGNWFRTPVCAFSQAMGPLAIEPGARLPRLFYAGWGSSSGSNALYAVTYVTADNDKSCPGGTNPNWWSDYNTYKTDDTVKQTISKADTISVGVFPNPSNDAFTIQIINSSPNPGVEIQVQDISGRTLYESHKEIPDGSNQLRIVWDATNVDNGIYFYRIKMGAQFFSGKMIKL